VLYGTPRDIRLVARLETYELWSKHMRFSFPLNPWRPTFPGIHGGGGGGKRERGEGKGEGASGGREGGRERERKGGGA
jgi:hypothetical protein